MTRRLFMSAIAGAAVAPAVAQALPPALKKGDRIAVTLRTAPFTEPYTLVDICAEFTNGDVARFAMRLSREMVDTAPSSAELLARCMRNLRRACDAACDKAGTEYVRSPLFRLEERHF